MSKVLCLSSFALGSAHETFDLGLIGNPNFLNTPFPHAPFYRCQIKICPHIFCSELSELATDIQRDEDLYFPIWNDVIERIHTNQRMLYVPWSEEDLVMLQNCHNYSKFCEESLFGSWKPEATVLRYTRYQKGCKGVNAMKQEEYANMFGPLLKTKKDVKVVIKSDCNDDASTVETTKLNKGLSLEVISNYYKRENTKTKLTDRGSRARIDKNRYIRYWCPVERTRDLSTPWEECVLPNSFRQLVELCAKMIFCEPATLLNVIEMLEEMMFKEFQE
jgi:hypothetical protein